MARCKEGGSRIGTISQLVQRSSSWKNSELERKMDYLAVSICIGSAIVIQIGFIVLDGILQNFIVVLVQTATVLYIPHP